MERKFAFVEGQFYHIFNRGVEKRPIFRDQHDWDHFHQLLYLCNSKKPLVRKLIQGLPLEWDRGEKLTSLIAYTLMQNHFHLLAHEDSQGSLSKFMGKLSTSYSMYFNTKYDRSGPLFCHPYRARHITSNEYFRWVFSYIHLNPVAGESIEGGDWDRAHALLSTYEYSSYRDYFACKRPETKILSSEKLPIDISDLEDIRTMSDAGQSLQGLPLE